MLRHDHGKRYAKKIRIIRQFRRPSFGHRIASRKKGNPTFSIAMYMDIEGSFHEVFRLKHMPPLVSLDSMPTLGQGFPWKKHKIETLTSGEPLKTLQRRRERKGYRSVTGFCKQKQILPPKTGVRPLFLLNNSGIGKFWCCKKNKTKYQRMFKENYNFSVECNGLLANNFERHGFVTRGVLQASKDHFTSISSKSAVTNLTWFFLLVPFLKLLLLGVTFFVPPYVRCRRIDRPSRVKCASDE